MDGLSEIIAVVIVGWFFLKLFVKDRNASGSAFKRCKYCGSRIPIKASVCPHCTRHVGSLGSPSEEINYMLSGSVGFILKLVIGLTVAIAIYSALVGAI